MAIKIFLPDPGSPAWGNFRSRSAFGIIFKIMNETDTKGGIPFQVFHWADKAVELHPGVDAASYWHVLQLPGLRIRNVTYEPGYLADHWCRKGHIVYCLEGSLQTELDTGELFIMEKDMGYVVSDDLGAHRSFTEKGARLLIIDGDFLRLPRADPMPGQDDS